METTAIPAQTKLQHLHHIPDTPNLLFAFQAAMASRVAAKAVDFARIYSSLGLSKETVASLQAFRKRHSEAQRIHAQLSAQPTTIDISYYRSVLKNQAVVDEAERTLKEFKPVTYDVQAHIKAIEAFEATAVAKAQETSQRIDEELKDLQATLENIEQARPFEDLTVEQVGEAHPHLASTVETMMKKGKWTVPGYKEKFGDLSMA
ncbi:ATP synthase d subunit [Ramaria rubella]|nr:ATP synthase d subunit [Ramaria rubella]